MGVPTSYCPPLLLAEEGVTSGHLRACSPPMTTYRTEGAAISEAKVGVSKAEVGISRAEIGEVVRRMARRLMEQEGAATLNPNPSPNPSPNPNPYLNPSRDPILNPDLNP